MPQALPQPSPSSSPWHHTTSTLVSPTDSTPAAGKTSQVLAKLTAECDRLRREIKAEKAAREEAVQQFQALKTRVNWLEEKNSMLSLQLDTNGNALARKERRMDDLKAGLEEEIARRKRAEEREAEMGRKLGETVSQAAKDVSSANTARKAAENAYATLENEYSGLTRRIAFLRKEVETLTSKINENSAVHKRQVLQLEVLVDQQRQAQEKSERQVGEMASLLRGYRETEENAKRLEGEMQRAVHEMRWVMRLHESRTEQGQAREGAREENREVRVEAKDVRRHAQKQSQGSISLQPSSPKQRRKPAPVANGVPL
jgi:chromosome segregation ATPase